MVTGNVPPEPQDGLDQRWEASMIEPQVCDLPDCDGETTFSENCGAYVCMVCDKHIGLTRCYDRVAAFDRVLLSEALALFLFLNRYLV